MTGISEPYVPRGEAEVLAEALSLLPPGWLLPRDADSGIAAVLGSWAGALADLEQLAAAMMDEVDPRTATATMGDWERVLGRDPCMADPATLSLSQRRAIAHQRWTARGGSSIPYFLGLADALGYEITIVEPKPFECGVSACGDTSALAHGGLRPVLDGGGAPILDADGDPILARRVYPRWEVGPEDLRFCWVVTVYSRPVVWFRTGGDGSQCGVDPMVRIGVASDLECTFRRARPAHTELIFNYDGGAP